MNSIVNFERSKLVEGMSNADYHAHPSLSSSGIKKFLRSPLHYWAEYLSPDRQAKEPSASMVLGTLVHALFLEPDQFDLEFVVQPDGIDRRTKDGKAAYAAFQAQSSGKTVITAEQHKQAQRMTAQLEAAPIARILDRHDGVCEASIFYADPDTGVACKVRPDWALLPCDAFPNGLIIDLKTTDDARPAAFARTCANFGYDISAAMYCAGFQQYTQTNQPPDFLFMVVERDSPHAVAVYHASPDMLEAGRQKLLKALPRFAHCQSTGEWPGYSTLAEPIDLPTWAN